MYIGNLNFGPVNIIIYPGRKGPRERAVSASVGGYNAVIRGSTRIIIVLRPVTPNRTGTKINDASVLTLK